jgi:hypothetical protein
MALGSTQLLTEISTKNLPGDEMRSELKVVIPITIFARIVYNIWEPYGLPRPVAGIAL